MKYVLRVYRKNNTTVAYLFEPKNEIIYDSNIEMNDSPTIGNIRNLFKNEFGFSIDDYGSREIELTIEGVCRLGSCEPKEENKNVINIYLREEDYNDWKSFIRDRNINKIIN